MFKLLKMVAKRTDQIINDLLVAFPAIVKSVELALII